MPGERISAAWGRVGDALPAGTRRRDVGETASTSVGTPVAEELGDDVGEAASGRR